MPESEEKHLKDVNSSFVLKETLRNLALLFSLVTAITFYIGFFYYGSYVRFFGLSTDMFPISFEEMLICGVEAYWAFLFDHQLSILYLMLVIPAVHLIIFLLLSNKAVPFVRKAFDYFEKRPLVNASQQEIAGGIFCYVFKCAGVFVIIASLLLLRFYASEQGKETAQSYQQRIVDGTEAETTFKLKQLSYLDAENLPRTVDTYSLTTSSTHSAFYVGSDVLVLPASRILAIRNIGVKPESETTAETEVTQ
ncbi:MAG: hypothetical protein JRG71_04455 [Deltaproteobacteria bacterium]|nr:hypothetical protein [Deltaproteobacteria bacterium]